MCDYVLFIKQCRLAGMGVTELNILPIADEMHHVTLPGHEWSLKGLLWKGSLTQQKGAAALPRLCHLMTL